MSDAAGRSRAALLLTHTGRQDAAQHARRVVDDLRSAGFTVFALGDEAALLGMDDEVVTVDKDECATSIGPVEMVLALGGDGTFLRAAHLARSSGAPLLGVNFGRVGFLAEAEIADIDEVVGRIVAGDYTVDERLTVEADVVHDGEHLGSYWALNEAGVEKGEPARMLEVLVEVDGRRLSRYGCDGVVCATPTGSTAHAMSAGGPVVWPAVSALLLVPVSAHTLFSRPLVVGPDSTIGITIEPSGAHAVLTCDGRRTIDVPPGATVTIRRGRRPVRVVRLTDQPFTDRLVAKLSLPVNGWRGNQTG